MQLLHTDSLSEARKKLQTQTSEMKLKTQWVKTEEAMASICAKDIWANENVPSFRRSTVDGYAIKAKDSYGASETNPLFFNLLGHISIDEVSSLTIQANQAIQVQTGSMIPAGADAVVMVEYCEMIMENQLVCYKAVSINENVTQIGEDIKCGECLIHQGKKIDAYDIGVLVSLGIQEIEVYPPLKVSILSCGDELIDFHETKQKAQIRDVNTHTLSHLALGYGWQVVYQKLLSDQKKEITQAVNQASLVSDVVILSAGSSKGQKDYTYPVFEEISHNVFTHGISIKPGKPTLLAYNNQNETLYVGLPGHPLAAILMMDLLVYDWFLQKTHAHRPLPYYATIQENVSSNQGRETCLLVSLVEKNQDYLAYPIYTKSAHISALTHAFGYTLIPANHEGLKKGERILIEVLR